MCLRLIFDRGPVPAAAEFSLLLTGLDVAGASVPAPLVRFSPDRP